MPRDQLDFCRIHAGFNGRPKSATVLVCASCTHVVAADGERREREEKKLIGLLVAVVAIACFFFLLIAIIQAK
jgi:hypothetical protein